MSRRVTTGWIICLLLWMTMGESQSAERHGTLVVEMNGFHFDRGWVRVGVFNKPDGFPMDSTKALTGAKVTIHHGQAEAVFPDLVYGTYAVAAHHDVNMNYRVDFNWLHLLAEPVGFSNHARIILGPPSFDAAKFELDADTVRISISVK